MDTIKIIVLGQYGVGKSCLLHRFRHNKFRIHEPTINIETRFAFYNLDGHRFKLDMYDTAGTERYKAISRNYYRNCHGVMLVYDIEDIQSFLDIYHWLKEVENYANDNIVKILVGNKLDKKHSRSISVENAQNFAKSQNALYSECSALTGYNVEPTFEHFIRQIYETQLPSIDEAHELKELRQPREKYKCPCFFQ